MHRQHHSCEEEHKPRRSRWRPNCGLALLSVLWVLTLLALMAATFMRASLTEVNLARNLLEQTQAEALADAGVYWAVVMLSEPVSNGGWWIDGQVHSLRVEDGEVRVAIDDEGGKIDLNKAGRELLRALFLALGETPEHSDALADATMDFRDQDNLRQVNGAEDDDYRAAGLAYDAKDAPFEDVSELQQVFGISAGLYRDVRPAVTVHTRKRAPNVATATALVKAALTRRQLEESGEAVEELSEEEMSEPLTLTADELLQPGLRSRLSLYAIHAEGRTPGGAVFARQAVVRVTESPDIPYQLFEWGQGERRLFPQNLEEE